MVTAAQFLKQLSTLKSAPGVNNAKHFQGEDEWNKILNVRMGEIFRLAKQYVQMSIDQVNELLDSDYYEARVGAVSIMDFQARDKKLPESRKKELYDLY